MENELQKRQESGLAVASEIDDMFGGSQYQIPIDAPLPQVLILRETPAFETQAGDTVKHITGHIIYYHNANQYYDVEFGEGEQGPPRCASPDGITPKCDTPEHSNCRECPMNEYGSAKEGKGKACQNTIRMYVLVDGEVIPCVIKAPPSSLGKKESLLKWLTNAPNVAAKAGIGTKYQPIKVKFSLHKKDFKDSGFSASVLDLETVRVLTPVEDMDEIVKLAKLHKEFVTNYLGLGRIEQDVATEKATSDQPETETTDDDNVPI